ncbi:MAG: DNA polymerase I [Methanotrichaceae archaeon]|nr:DNA polymerase I [Methanotrichaceae archaeon]
MWIFDSGYNGAVELWSKTGVGHRRTERSTILYSPSFYLHLKDPHAHWEMIEALESLFQAEECTFRSIYGPLDGYKIYAGRKVAERIEIQTRMAAELYNVDLRQDLRYMSEKGLFPCGEPGESRFSPEFDVMLRIMAIRVAGDPQRAGNVDSVEVKGNDLGDDLYQLKGEEGAVLADLFGLVSTIDPDVILFPHADSWMHPILDKARRYGLDSSFSRSGRFREMASRSYWSYGKTYHKEGGLMPEGRVLIDTESSFVFREADLAGILLASRLTGLPPNLAARFTPGTLVSTYEVYEAIRRGVAVPFRKRDCERPRPISALREADKGGMIFQPVPGVYQDVFQIDFTSMYPSIIVNYNLSPETLDAASKAEALAAGSQGSGICRNGLDCGGLTLAYGSAIGGNGIYGGDMDDKGPDWSHRRGFLSSVLEPLLRLRIETKRQKKVDSSYRGLDSILKWMLVVSFGYTGYRNAKFGQIGVYESITSISRELLMQVKEIAEEMGLSVLHGIVDCLWVQGPEIQRFKEAVEKRTGISTEVESYDWIAFLDQADGSGAYNRYYGRLSTGEIKARGVMARKGDTPEYVRRMQMELFDSLAKAKGVEDLSMQEPEARAIYGRYRRDLPDARPQEMAIRRRISRLRYSRRCAEGAAVEAYRRLGVAVAPGMEIGYLVRDSSRWVVDAEMEADRFDIGYYRRLLDKAWGEVAFVFGGG